MKSVATAWTAKTAMIVGVLLVQACAIPVQEDPNDKTGNGAKAFATEEKAELVAAVEPIEPIEPAPTVKVPPDKKGPHDCLTGQCSTNNDWPGDCSSNPNYAGDKNQDRPPSTYFCDFENNIAKNNPDLCFIGTHGAPGACEALPPKLPDGCKDKPVIALICNAGTSGGGVCGGDPANTGTCAGALGDPKNYTPPAKNVVACQNGCVYENSTQPNTALCAPCPGQDPKCGPPRLVDENGNAIAAPYKNGNFTFETSGALPKGGEWISKCGGSTDESK